MSQVDKALKAFEYTTEWADLIAGEIYTELNLLFVFLRSNAYRLSTYIQKLVCLPFRKNYIFFVEVANAGANVLELITFQYLEVDF